MKKHPVLVLAITLMARILIWSGYLIGVGSSVDRFGASNSSTTSVILSSSMKTPEFPNFIRPSINPTANCNLWGPLCQTGLIEVEVKTMNVTTKTTVPCSYYLTAQAQSAMSGRRIPRMDYQRSFGHSPECSTYAEIYNAESFGEAESPHFSQVVSSVLDFSNCGSITSGRFDFPNSNIPVGVSNVNYGGGAKDFLCCGECTLTVPEIRLLYFASTTYDCSTKYNVTYSNSTSSSGSKVLQNRAHSIVPMRSTFISDGYTFSSPSFYLQIVGTAAVQDSCGQVGYTYSNAIVPVPAGGLSTVSLNLPIGATFGMQDFARESISSDTKPVKIEDLVCPTWGLAANAIENTVIFDQASIGPPFFPILQAPPELFSFDAQWARCSKFRELGVDHEFLIEIFDPPRELTQVNALTPATTPAKFVTAPDSTPSAKDSPKPAPAIGGLTKLPVITAKPNPQKPNPAKTNPLNHDPGKPGPKNFDPAKPGPGTPDPEKLDPVNSDPANPGPKSPIESSNDNKDPKPSPGMVPDTESGGKKQSSLGLEAIMFSAFGNSGSSNAPVENVKERTFSIGASTFTFTPVILTTHGLAISVLPSTIKIGDSTLSEGGNPLTVSGIQVLLRPLGLFVGDNPPSILFAHNLAPTPTTGPFLVTAASHKITVLDASRIALAGSTLLANLNPVTVSNAIISLAPDGKLVVASRSGAGVSDRDSSITRSPLVYTLGGNVFTANPTGFTISDTSILPSGAAIAISGIPLSLDSSGNLYLGGILTSIPYLSGIASTDNILDDGSITALRKLPPYLAASTLEIDSHIFIIYSSSLVIDGTTLRTNGPEITISGKAFLLDSLRNLEIGTRPTSAPRPSTFTVNGETFTGNPSGLTVDGTTILPGGAGIVISGTPISLGPSDELHVGHSRAELAPGGNPSGEDQNGAATGSATAFTGDQNRLQASITQRFVGMLCCINIIILVL